MHLKIGSPPKAFRPQVSSKGTCRPSVAKRWGETPTHKVNGPAGARVLQEQNMAPQREDQFLPGEPYMSDAEYKMRLGNNSSSAQSISIPDSGTIRESPVIRHPASCSIASRLPCRSSRASTSRNSLQSNLEDAMMEACRQRR